MLATKEPESNQTYLFVEDFQLVKTAIKSIDLPDKRCRKEGDVESGIEDCTVDYLESMAGCSMPWERKSRKKLPGILQSDVKNHILLIAI